MNIHLEKLLKHNMNMLFIALAVIFGLLIWVNVAGVPLVITLGVIALLCALLAMPKKSLGEDK